MAEKLGRDFMQMANPVLFTRNPRLAWGFYGHRFSLYRDTTPHHGFSILKKWCDLKPMGGFVYTSNVDGHFQKSGFDQSHVVECHGSINHLQCIDCCCDDIWPAGDTHLEINEDELRAINELPSCHNCGAVARPNILMFGDWGWIEDRTEEQQFLLRDWLSVVNTKKLVVIEIGAGITIPSVRNMCSSAKGALIRINPAEYKTPPGGISLPLGALDALTQINKHISNL